MNVDRCIYCGAEIPEGYGHICKLCEWKLKASNDVGVQVRMRKTWNGYKPRKEATKKERIERARKKHKGKEE